MDQTKAILFWMSGVVTQPVSTAAAGLLQAAGRPGVQVGVLPEFIQAHEQFTLGQMGDLDFCRQLGRLTRLESEPDALRQKMLAAFAPESLTLDVIRALPEAIERWLVVDLPRAWYEALAGRLSLPSCFAPERLVFLDQSGLKRLVPDVFYYLSQCARQEAGGCLLIDPRLRRAMAGIDHGFPSAHHVNLRLLKQEFYLRGFTGRTSLSHNPDQKIQ